MLLCTVNYISHCSCKSVVLPVEEGENGPVTPESPDINTQDTKVNGSTTQLKDGKNTTSQNSIGPHAGRRVSRNTFYLYFIRIFLCNKL